MEEAQLKILNSKFPDQIKLVLENFNNQHASLFNFEKFHAGDQWFTLWRAVFAVLDDTSLCSLHPLALNTVRILTRDELSLQKHNISNDLECLLTLAALTDVNVIDLTAACGPHEEAELEETAATPTPSTLDATATETIGEALKCLCNLIYQSAECRRQCCKNNTTAAILRRVASPVQFPSFIELYDMKLLFLITALEPAARSRVQLDLNGITYMTEWLDEKLSEAECSSEQLDILVEMLKVMFNITTTPDKSPNENEIQNLHLTCVLRKLLLTFSAMGNESEYNVVTHAVNLLTNISGSCLTELITKCEPGAEETPQQLVFEGRNVRALDVLLRYLRHLLEEQEKTASSYDLVPPILTVLVKCARCQPVMRRYIRSTILPPLRDATHRPEVGAELRNHLCRFLTLPAMLVRDLAAELLFICCKENVGRMIKYTGYGNAAGLFANRGLLDCRSAETALYSSDSEDSDTEEYKNMQHKINPVLGCYESPKRNPLEGMSEEQKEYEAMQLVELMEKLHKTGVVQPCRIGEDGKPQPVDHILQLQEQLPQQQFEQKRKT